MSLPATAAPMATAALARDPRRMLAAPALLTLIGVATAAPGLLVGGLGIGLLVGGGLLVAAGLWLAIRILSLRLLVEPDYLHLRGVGTDRRYHLAPGSLSRLATAGPRRVSLRVRLGSLGWAVGRAALSSGESVEVIRLANTPAVILVPTERGRVALAVASEADFVEALRAGARARAERPTPPLAAPRVIAAPVPAPWVAPQPAPAFERAMPPRPLTGIERMWLEDRLARERRAAITGAREEQAAASFTARVAALTPTGAKVVQSLPPPVTAVASVATAAATAATAATAAPAALTPPAPSPASVTRAIPRRRPLRPMARRVTRPELTPGLVLVATPLVGALFSWLLAVITGAAPGASGLDPLAAALLLCGPVAALAIFLAYRRWPRLAGLSSVATMVALLLVARALIG